MARNKLLHLVRDWHSSEMTPTTHSSRRYLTDIGPHDEGSSNLKKSWWWLSDGSIRSKFTRIEERCLGMLTGYYWRISSLAMPKRAGVEYGQNPGYSGMSETGFQGPGSIWGIFITDELETFPTSSRVSGTRWILSDRHSTPFSLTDVHLVEFATWSGAQRCDSPHYCYC